jgi:hypothetical protein
MQLLFRKPFHGTAKFLKGLQKCIALERYENSLGVTLKSNPNTWDVFHTLCVSCTVNKTRLTSGRPASHKINDESLSQHDEKHVVQTSHSGIRIGKRRTTNKQIEMTQAIKP